MTSLEQRLEDVRVKIAAAAERVGRSPSEVRLVAVSKRHPAEAIRAAAQAGVSIVGENYAQEMVAKIEEVGLPELAWHFIGRLQRNKVKDVIGRAALLHCIDSDRLLREIDKRAADADVVQDVLIAVNLAGEAQKSGVQASECEGLVALAGTLSHLRCNGFMAMPPMPKVPEDSRPYFRQLRSLRDTLATDDTPLSELSMGTTGDYEVAVEEGATLVRVGTAVFGPRPG